MSRRKSTFQFNRPLWQDPNGDAGAEDASQELERLEQETTLVLQEIDHNLSRATAVINDKMFPVLKKYALSTEQVWKNVGFWKHFMEEAAGVEIKTASEPSSTQENSNVEAGRETRDQAENSAVNNENSISDASVSPPRQLQASTPLKPGHRDPVSSDRRRYSGSGKNTPLGSQIAAEARRSSLLLNYMNSSPTFPEPPVLMSDIGRFHNNSSSSAVRPAANAQFNSLSDSADLGLDRLSPVLLPSLAVSPQGESAAQAGSGRRNTENASVPNIGSSQRKRSGQDSHISPIRRGLPQYTELEHDASDIPEFVLTSRPTPRADESEDMVAPNLATLKQHDGGDAKKRKVANDDNINVFLDHGDASRNTSTVYHTMVPESAVGEPSPKPRLFENVLSAGPRETFNLNEGEENGEDAGAGAMSPNEDATMSVDILTSNPDAEDPAPEPGVEPAAPENLSHHAHSFEHTGNSSEMDSFFKEKWRVLSNTSKKG